MLIQAQHTISPKFDHHFADEAIKGQNFVDTPVYIMTSEKANDVIYAYLEKMKFLGFKNLFVFPQVNLPNKRKIFQPSQSTVSSP